MKDSTPYYMATSEYLKRLKVVASKAPFNWNKPERSKEWASPEAEEIFKYHRDMSNELVDELSVCSDGKGKYAGLSEDEKLEEMRRLYKLSCAHSYKARIWGQPIGYWIS